MNQLELNGIINLLTLRHNPLNRSHTFRKLVPKDFAKSIDMDQIFLEALIKKQITNYFKLRKPKTIVVPLSGGVDSTLILQLVKECLPKGAKLHAVCMGFGHESDEIPEAKKISRTVGAIFHPLPVPNILNGLEYHIRVVDEPRWNTYYGYVLAAAKALHADAVITGDGGDELFGGYIFRYKKFLDKYSGSLDWSKKRTIAYIEAAYERDYVQDQKEMFGSAIKFSWDKIVDLVEPNFINSLPPLDQVFMADFNGKLVHDYVPTNSSLERGFEIQSFSPMLTDAVIDYATKLSPWDKYNESSGIGKLPLRAILVSKGLSKFMLPQKTGYGTDLPSLWKRHGKDTASILGGETRIVQLGLIERKWIDRHFYPELEDPRYINKLLQLVALEYYLQWKGLNI